MALPPYPGSLVPQVGSISSAIKRVSNVFGSGSSSLPQTTQHPTPFPTVQDELSLNLQEVLLNNIPFPVEFMNDNEGHRLARHTFYSVDAARIENTGRKSSIFNFRAIFCNTISPVSGMENWKQGTLFPQVYQQLLSTLETPTSFPFQHPFKKGIIQVNVVDYKTQWRNDWRGGAVIDITLEETIPDTASQQLANPVKPQWNDPVILANTIGNTILDLPQPGNNSLGEKGTAIVALLLTAMLAVMNSPTFFADTIQNIQALAEAPATLAGAFVQNVEHCIFVCKQIQLILKSQNDPAYAQLNSDVINMQYLMQQQLQRLSNLQPIGGVLQQPAHPIIIYITIQPVTLTHLTGILSNTLDQLLQLNPQFLTSPIIPTNTAIRYYDFS